MLKKSFMCVILTIFCIFMRGNTLADEVITTVDINKIDPVYRMVDLYANKNEAEVYKRAIDTAHLTYNVPRKLIASVIFYESRFRTKARSRCNALGPMQLTHYHWYNINPLDITDNILRGTYILSKYYERFGSWDKALSAYNAGPTVTRRWVRKAGSNWYKLAYKETRIYINRVLTTVALVSGEGPASAGGVPALYIF